MSRHDVTTPLIKLAKTINNLAKREDDARRAFAIAIAGAQDRVKRESNMTFEQWSTKYLRKPDGSKWALSYLYKMAMFGRNPKKLEQGRASIAVIGRRARRALRTHQLTQIGGTLPDSDLRQLRGDDAEREMVDRLLAAWHAATPEAQRKFLAMVTHVRVA